TRARWRPASSWSGRIRREIRSRAWGACYRKAPRLHLGFWIDSGTARERWEGIRCPSRHASGSWIGSGPGGRPSASGPGGAGRCTPTGGWAWCWSWARCSAGGGCTRENHTPRAPPPPPPALGGLCLPPDADPPAAATATTAAGATTTTAEQFDDARAGAPTAPAQVACGGETPANATAARLTHA